MPNQPLPTADHTALEEAREGLRTAGEDARAAGADNLYPHTLTNTQEDRDAAAETLRVASEETLPPLEQAHRDTSGPDIADTPHRATGGWSKTQES